MRLLISLIATASVAQGFVPMQSSAKICRFGEEKQATALFSAVPQWDGSDQGKATVTKNVKKSSNPVVPAFVNGITLGGVAFAAALCSLFFHVDPIMLLGAGVLMAAAAAVAGASDKQAVLIREPAPIETSQPVESSTFTEYETIQEQEEPFVSKFEVTEPYVDEFETLEAAETDFMETLESATLQETPIVSDPEFPTSNAYSAPEYEMPVPTTPIDPPIGSPLEVVDPNFASEEPITGISYSEDVTHMPLVPATALYSSASTQLDADEVPLRTKIDRIKAELKLAEEFFDENL